MAASPQLKKRVLVDASSAIILFKCNLHDHLVHYYQILLPESVFSELTCEGYDGSDVFAQFRAEKKITVPAFNDNSGNEHPGAVVLTGLGAGERDAILLFLRGMGDMILIDDGKGAGYCKKNDIPYINALLVPRILQLGGQISSREAEMFMDSVISYGRYSRSIIEFARTCSDEELARFA